TQAKLGEMRREYRKHINKFRDLLRSYARAGQPIVSIQEGIDALSDLQAYGYYFLGELLGPSARFKLPIVRELVREACQGWDAPKWHPKAAIPNLVIIKTSIDHGIPFDMLPLLNFDVPKTQGFEKLGELACSFLGFSAIIKRETMNSVWPSSPLENI